MRPMAYMHPVRNIKYENKTFGSERRITLPTRAPFNTPLVVQCRSVCLATSSRAVLLQHTRSSTVMSAALPPTHVYLLEQVLMLAVSCVHSWHLNVTQATAKGLGNNITAKPQTCKQHHSRRTAASHPVPCSSFCKSLKARHSTHVRDST
jgi:hypothetical protein